MKNVKRGEIYYADLSPVIGSEQDGTRPVLILQNDIGNRFSPTTIIAPMTSVPKKQALPTHIVIDYDFLESKSTILLEQIRTIDKSRLREKVCHLDQDILQKIDQALCISLAIEEKTHQ